MHAQLPQAQNWRAAGDVTLSPLIGNASACYKLKILNTANQVNLIYELCC